MENLIVFWVLVYQMRMEYTEIAVVVTRLKNLTSDFSGLQMRNCFISNLTKMELLLDVEKMSVPVVDIEQLER